MAEPLNPHSTPGENTEPSSPMATEEEAEGNAPGEDLPVLRWSKSLFDVLMRDIQMPPEYGAIYPQEGDIAGDAPTGYVTMWSDFFGVCNLRLPLTVFVAEVLEWKARPVVREKSGEDAPLWRMFCLDFKGKVVVLACEDGDEGFNYTIRDNFRLPERDAMQAVLPQGKGDLGALGDSNAAGFPKQHVEKHGDKRFRKPKKQHEPVVVLPLVPEVAGTSRTHLRKYNDYVVVSDTLEGLGVLGGSAATGGSLVGVKHVDDKKRKVDASDAGGQKGPKLRRTRTAAIPRPKPAVTTGNLIICYTSVAIPDVTDRCSLFCV
ncbi:hypothetical protein HanPI659440_Chr09g0326801 [Helianthus annuus]|nr:hypothetical protein HanPI659440_Chr09g0326801 [Helianthus annuus]